mgnify:CR=1 FL=1
MLESTENIKTDKLEGPSFQPLEIFEELDNEVKSLNEELLNLQSIEKTLMAKIEEEIDNKRRARDELKRQVEELRLKCDELTKIFNELVQTNM